MPDNCKNFSSGFSYRRKPLSSWEIECTPKESRPAKPHPLVLANRFKELLDTGVVNNRAELARRMGMSRARVTQLLNLLRLPTEIRQEILALPEHVRRQLTERRLRGILGLPSRSRRLEAFEGMRPGL